jgi:hypothetical protein
VDKDYQEPDSRTVQELLAQVRELEQKVARLQRERSVYAAKARLLSEELEKYRSRELRQDNTVETLLERQREMHVMLNRSHIMLAKAQNATAMLSLEFGELARALPETVSAQADADPGQAQTVQYEIDDRIRRINDLFRMTGELSQEIAETLQGTEKAMNAGSRGPSPDAAQKAPPPDEPARSGPSGASAPPSPEPYAPAAGAAPESQPAEPGAALDAELVEAAFREDEPVSQAAGDRQEETEEADAPPEEVAAAAQPADAVPASREASVAPDPAPRAAVPPPKDIFGSTLSAPRRKVEQPARPAAAAGAGAGRTSSGAITPEDTTDAREAREALDRLVREQEERDLRAGGPPRKRGLWSRLFGG